MKTLLAGPWVGEFGWELFEWQSFLRYRSQNYDKVIVSSRPGHEIIYKDFADEFIPYESSSQDCCGWTNYTTKLDESKFSNIKYTDWIKPGKYLKGKQRFESYGNIGAHRWFDVVLHARHVTPSKNYLKPHKQKSQRNGFGITEWRKISRFLAENNKTACSIGLPKSSMWVEGTMDLRGISLFDLADALTNSKLCIGPSSGPMHFASLCQCPHLVWTSSKNIDKYKTKWNPFNTKVFLHIDDSWHPSIQDIKKKIEEAYNGLT